MSWRAESTYQRQSAFAEDEKEYLKLAKKLREILKLEEKVKGGESLAQNQQDKVDSKDSLLQEVTKLAGKLPGDSDVLEKTQDITALLPAKTVKGIEQRRQQEQERRQNREKKQEEERRAPVFMCRHDRPILSVCVSADSRYLFTCSKDGNLICWSLEEKLLKALYTFAGHTGAVFTLDVTSAPPLLISGSADGQVKFWEGDPTRLTPLTVTSPKNTLEHGGRVRVLRWCPFDEGSSGRRFASASEKLGSKPAVIAVWHASPAGETKQLLEIKATDGRCRRQVVYAVKNAEKKRKLISPQRRIQRLFVEEFKKTFFSPNPWYESPEFSFPGGNPQKIYNYWMTTRPTRDIERVDDGQNSCGCTWTQLDGRRGASFVSFNQEGQVVYVREVCEPQGLGGKFKDNTLKSLQTLLGAQNMIQNIFSALDRILVQEDADEGPKPVNGLEAPRSGRAVDVVRYLWEEAQWDPVDPVEKIMSQFSEDAVYEDLTREDPAFVGWEAIKKYQEETKENTPSNMRFVLDEMTEGVKACTAIWHVEFNTRLSPRGVTYYELNNEGKVCYVRSAYDISF